MRHDVTRIIRPLPEPSPTIGETALRERWQPTVQPDAQARPCAPSRIVRTVDFYDTAGRLHGLIVLAPVGYGVFQSAWGHALPASFWWMVLATVCFAIFARRPALVRLTPRGVSFPDRRSPEYAWEHMVEAHAYADELDILLIDGQHLWIPYRKLRRRDIERIKHLVRDQFQAMARVGAPPGTAEKQAA